MKDWTNIKPGMDAVILPPDDPFYNVATIIYINECANEGNGSMEIEYVDAERILELNEEVGENAEEFFGKLPDWFQGEWYYCDNTPDRADDFNSWVEAWFNADFIVGRDGELKEELEFLINWATDVIMRRAIR